MYCNFRSNPNLTDCTFTNNTAYGGTGGGGGGIYAYASGIPILTNTVMCNNSPNSIDSSNQHVKWIDGGGNCDVSSCQDNDADGWPDACSKDEDGVHLVPDEYASVQEAIEVANEGDVILIAQGIYFEHSINTLGKSILIKGETNPDGSPAVTIDAQRKGVVLTCNNGESSSTQFQNLLLTGGWNPLPGGGMNNFNSSPSIFNCVFYDNASSNGGGIFNTGGSSPNIHSCRFVDNTASQKGGGMSNLDSDPIVVNCTFTGNVAMSGGGIFSDNNSLPTLYDCNFCDNALPQIEGKYTNAGLNVIEEACPTDCVSDINGDGQIGVIDLLKVIDAWGDCENSPTPAVSGKSILDRQQISDLRIATWNVLSFHPDDGNKVELAPYARVLKAIDPDVIVLNEIDRPEDVEKLPQWLSDNVHEGIWQVHAGLDSGWDDIEGDRTVICSRYPMTRLAVNTLPVAWAGRGVTMALVDCPDEIWSTDFYLLGVHMKAFDDIYSQELRQWTADAIASWLGKCRTNSEEITLPQNTPMVVLGDTNFYPDQGNEPELAIMEGDIQHESFFGPDIKGDWDNSNLTDPIPLDPITGDEWTYWKSPDYAASRVDRFMFTDSVVQVGNNFILNTTTLPEDELLLNGLELLDTTEGFTSDHLPVVVDFQAPVACEADLNFDGIVDVSDLLIVVGNWGPCE
jgi:endonuclease/exonuclease/phosphatase family metal-dependent hydrolase